MSNENKKRGKLIVYTGCSGVGKGTIMEYLLKEFPELQFSVSATTRDPRPGEEHGVHYFFITHDEFNRMIENDEFLEHAVYCENQYGTPRKIVEDKLSEGINVILEIEVVGGTNVISRFPECVSIFILPPSIEELGRRLRKRGTEEEEVILKRLAQAEEEIKSAPLYKYQVINDKLEVAVDEVISILHKEFSE
ncbi:MAG: guanylate kinase [Ruminococcaceae bacterium]|nr:guanylate kinase [Oscillospiraceae bacterium]